MPRAARWERLPLPSNSSGGDEQRQFRRGQPAESVVEKPSRPAKRAKARNVG